LGDIHVNGRLILKWFFKEVEWELVDRIKLAQDRDQWQAVVSTVTNLRVPEKAGNFLIS
jgi:hypothetical protein